MVNSFDNENLCFLLRQYVNYQSIEALEVFFKRILDPCYRVAFKYFKNQSDAEDIVQTSFVKIMQNAVGFKFQEEDNEGQVMAWCLTIVSNCAKLKIRYDKNRRKRENKRLDENLLESNYTEVELKSETSNKEDLVKYVKHELDSLPIKYRIPISLRYIEGLSLTDIANALDMNPNTLRSILKRGLDKITENLDRKSINYTVGTLSVFLSSMTLDAAPAQCTDIIDKIIKLPITKSSFTPNQMATRKILLLSTKVIVISAIILGATIIGVFVIKHEPISDINKVKENINETSFNKSWSFEKGIDKELVQLTTGLFVDKQDKLLVAENDEFHILKFPIPNSVLKFEIQIEFLPKQNMTNSKMKLNVEGCLLNKDILLENKHKLFKFYTLHPKKLSVAKIICFDNNLYTIINNELIRMSVYSNKNKYDSFGLAFKNVKIKSIKANTISNNPLKSFDSNDLENDGFEWNQTNATPLKNLFPNSKLN